MWTSRWNTSFFLLGTILIHTWLLVTVYRTDYPVPGPLSNLLTSLFRQTSSPVICLNTLTRGSHFQTHNLLLQATSRRMYLLCDFCFICLMSPTVSARLFRPDCFVPTVTDGVPTVFLVYLSHQYHRLCLRYVYRLSYLRISGSAHIDDDLRVGRLLSLVVT